VFGEFREMADFVTLAPFFIVGAFVLTFAFVKVAQSDALYRWLSGKLDVWKAKQARKIRREMVADITAFLRGRPEGQLDPREQRIYYRMLDSYYAKMERLYRTDNDPGEEGSKEGMYD
jgi:hypothetical protein